MSCNIYINDKRVLKTTSGLFDTLYYSFEEILEQQSIYDIEIKSFMNNMEQANNIGCSYGFDIGENIKTSKNIFLIINLLEETIKKFKPRLKDWAVEDLWKFHGELAKYKEELESQGK